jgi:hypothetical protein
MTAVYEPGRSGGRSHPPPSRLDLARPPPELSFPQLDALRRGRLGKITAECPECSPLHRGRKATFAIWTDDGELLRYDCRRCGAHGAVRRNDERRPPPSREELERKRLEAARRRAEDEADRIAKAQAIWGRRKPLTGSPAETYYPARGIPGPAPDLAHYLPKGAFGLGWPHGLILPFGVAAEIEPGRLAIADNAVRGVHVTFLTPNGTAKAEMHGSAKRMGGVCKGSPLCLFAPGDGLSLIIGEGVENTLAIAAAYPGVGAWAAGCKDFMAALAPLVPSYLDTVMVAPDPKPEEQAAGRVLAEELCNLGLYVEWVRLSEQEGDR